MGIPVHTAPVTARARSMVALFAGVALMTTAMSGAGTAGTLIVSDVSGPGWSGLPNAAVVLGTALGSLGLGAFIARSGPRVALAATYGAAAAGGLVAFVGAVTATLTVLVGGLVLLGLGVSAAQLSRYVAAELYPEQRKGFGLSVIVWAGTVGALAGPALIAPAAAGAEWLDLPPLSGPVVVSALMTGTALVAAATLPRSVSAPEAASPPGLTLAMVAAALRRRAVVTPLVAMVGAQVAMVAVMTMTPLQLHHHGHGLGAVGWVLSAHMVGMFALAPLSGRIADRWGGRAAIGYGIATLTVAMIITLLAPTAHTTGLPLALFLLGYGWNLVFVGGSSLLSRDLPVDERTRLQGMVDAFVWGASALASLSAGQLFGLGGYALVAVVAGALAVAPIPLLVRRGWSRRPR